MHNFSMRMLAGLALAALLFAAPAVADDADKYSAEELEEIVGPIALYPDVVLSSVLPASGAATDVVSAARWLEKQDGEVEGAPKDSDWDEAVQALVQFPDVLIWMNENLDWMEQLAWAVSVQQEDVIAAIQSFRAKAKEAGNLETDEHQEVIEEDGIIEVQPTEPEVVYVPQYNPVYVTQPASTYPASYRGTYWASFAAGALGAWAVHSIRWGGHHGGHYGGGGININNSPTYNFNKGGNVNRVNNNRGTGGRNYNGQRPSTRGSGAPRGKGGVSKPRSPGWNNKRSNARPAKGGTKPGNRPSGGRKPGGRPSTRPSTRPSKAPKSPGGAGKRPGGSAGKRPSSRPSTRSGSKPKSNASRSKPSSSKSSFGGSNRGGSSARKSSSRGNSSVNRSKSSSSRSRSSGSSRSRSSGGSRGGGSRGGGSRGGGGGRRR